MPNGEFYGGLPDRHAVVSRAHVINILNVIEDMLLCPEDLRKQMKAKKGWDSSAFMSRHRLRSELNWVLDWNNEQLLAQHLERKGLISRIRLFPYVMYTARAFNDESATWSPGSYEPREGHYIKYRSEYQYAQGYSSIIKSRQDWESPAWRIFAMDPPPVPSIGFPEAVIRGVVKALKPPGRFARGRRFLKRVFHGLRWHGKLLV